MTGALEHLRGLLTAAVIDTAKYRDTQRQDRIGLDVSDIYDAAEEVKIVAHPTAYRQTLVARFYLEDDSSFAEKATMRLNGEQHECKVILKPGSYRVVVDGEDTKPASDVFAVVGPEGT
ncbi:hypothetical protein [Rhizobium leguminosarum]|uniref:Uncharacterized protein n=1 Tax=Rhizobium leguminosarum TaxID=384 RepID=A0A1B1C730_RHILE|nr:hypothetical protein [Rhizobium leguminosarum]ANP85592.1 hypothetical protein BA011_07500 [Rhizobium leguminosarum]